MKILRAAGVSAGGMAAAVAILAIANRPMLSAGDPAPDFTAMSADGTTVDLRQFRDRKNVILYFYPGDFTAGCTAEACAFRDRAAALADLDAVIIGVSFNSADSHRRFASQYNIPFILVSDSDRTIARRYGATWLSGLLPFPRRVTYLIDKKGFVRAVSHHEFAIGRHSAEMMAALEELEKK